MTLSNYPEVLDTDTNLYLVHDALRVTLAEDYNPGDTSIAIVGDPEIIALFPPTGIITLTEQCSDICLRALSFHYSSVTSTSFDGLTLLSEFADKDNAKPRGMTDVTLNVTAQHHDAIKDAVIAIQEFMGASGQVGTVPFEGTITERLKITVSDWEPVTFYSLGTLGITATCRPFPTCRQYP